MSSGLTLSTTPRNRAATTPLTRPVTKSTLHHAPHPTRHQTMLPACESRHSSAPPPQETASAVSITVTDNSPEKPGGEAAAAGRKEAADEPRKQKGREAAAGDYVTVDLGGDLDGETLCRICYLSPGRGDVAAEMILLGCRCKDDLGTAHRHCAEAWFRIKGNRRCEICGTNAKNITGEEDVRPRVVVQEHRTASGNNNTISSERVSWWKGQKFCNFLMACLVVSFILPWLFRVNVF